MPEVRELRQMREENARLKRLVADLTLDQHILQEVIRKSLRPARRRAVAQWIRDRYQVSCRRACALSQMCPDTWYYRSRARETVSERANAATIERLKTGHCR